MRSMALESSPPSRVAQFFTNQTELLRARRAEPGVSAKQLEQTLKAGRERWATYLTFDPEPLRDFYTAAGAWLHLKS